MPTICYIPKRFNVEHEQIIEHANRLLLHYQSIGVEVTGRSIYYRFIAMDLIPDTWIDPEYNLRHGLPATTKNTLKNYKRLLEVFNSARLAGVMDWSLLRDTLRDVERPTAWTSPQSIINAVAEQYRIDKWADQEHRVEVWGEKDAVEGILARVCPELNIAHFVCRGSPSQTSIWQAGQRFLGYSRRGQQPVVLYLGDHDPTGIDITRDITDRLDLFTGGKVIVVRIALNMDQIEQYEPPPNPAKTTDSRFRNYQLQHGDDSWELDALEPEVMMELIREAVLAYRDEDAYEGLRQRERTERALIRYVSNRWDRIASEAEDSGMLKHMLEDDEDEDEQPDEDAEE